MAQPICKEQPTFAQLILAGWVEPCQDFIDHVPHEHHEWMWINERTGVPSTGLKCPGYPEDETIEPCTCTIACIPQGITEDQTCRLSLSQ